MGSLEDQRRDYLHGTLEAADLGDDPIAAVRKWIDDAVAAQLPEATAMTLATIDADGAPSARVVLCKGIETDGVVFYTSYESRKGRALAGDDRAAVCFHWPQLERQLRLEGRVAKLSREQNERYFHSRPRQSQLAALASHQSAVIADRRVLLDEVARLDAAHPSEVPLPEAWGGYLLTPSRIELWQGRASRMHDRIEFLRDGDRWRSQRLSP